MLPEMLRIELYHIITGYKNPHRVSGTEQLNN